MAYRAGNAQTFAWEPLAASTYSPNVGNLDFVADDYVVCIVSNTTCGTITESGSWTLVQQRSGVAGTSGSTLCFAYQKAAGTTITNPAFAGITGGRWSGGCFVIRDADATTFLDAATITNNYAGAAVVTGATGAITPTNNNSLLIAAVSNQLGSARWLPDDYFGVFNMSYNTTAASGCGIAVGSKQQITAAASANPSWYGSVSGEAVSMILAIRNKSGGKLAVDGVGATTKVRWHGDFGSAASETYSWAAPNSFAASIGGITCSSTIAAQSTTGFASPPIDVGKFTSLTSTENTAGVDTYVGAVMDMGSAQDWSGKSLSCEIAVSSTSLYGPKGVVIGLSDGTNWKTYEVAKVEKLTNNIGYTIFLDSSSGEFASSGTLAWTSIRYIAFLWSRNSSATTSRSLYIKNMLLHGTHNLIGGNSARPLKTTDIYDLLFGASGYAGLSSVQGANQLQLYTNLQLGDGTRVTYCDLTSCSIEVPDVWDGVYQRNWQIGTNGLTVTIKANASDTYNVSTPLLNIGNIQSFTIDAASSASASYNYSGCTFFRFDYTDNAGVLARNGTFNQCDTVSFAGNVTNCAVLNTVSTTAAATVTASGKTLDGCTIDVTGTSADYHISLGASVTAITLNGTTLSGTPGTTKFYSELASGTLTITTDGTGTAIADTDVTFIGGSTATAEIAAPQVYQSVVISGFTAGSRIQIYDTTSATELFNGTASAGDTVISGSTATWTDPTAAAADRAIRVRVAYVNGTSAEQWQQFTGLTCGQTGATAEITYPVTPIDDDTYNSNAIDGPTIYATSGITFTDAATDLVNISIAGGAVTWQTIYACFVYWLFTAAGIDDDVAYIDAPDPANYLLTSMKLKNTHANPLTVTGGYGRSATTGLVADIIDTAGSTGNIFPSPDHVVAYATGSGALTAGDITNIWAAATRTLSATQDANIVQVAGITVDGTGTDGDPWGPA